jgi:hypothetical protein
MRVTFRKRRRRYEVHVQRDLAPDLWIASAPGYDDDLPHDLLHFVAEAEFGLDGGVFGDLAAGGNAKIFVPVDRTRVAKLWRRKRAHPRPLRDGRRSEELATQLERGWRERSLPTPLLATLDDLARRWRTLQHGGSITLGWPRPEGRKRHPARNRRYSSRSRQARSPSRQ